MHMNSSYEETCLVLTPSHLMFQSQLGLFSRSSTAAATPPARFKLPDLFSICPFELRINPRCKLASVASEKWLNDILGKESTDKQRKYASGSKTGLLASMCYPTVDNGQLRTCCDFLNMLMHLENTLSTCDVHETGSTANAMMSILCDPVSVSDKSHSHLERLAQSISSRLHLGRPSVRRRFTQAMDLYFLAKCQFASDRADDIVPDLESYITLRRDSSGCKASFALIEYAQGIEIPDAVLHHPAIHALTQAANDLVSWSSDVFSYNTAQSQHDQTNIVAIVMKERGIDAQTALDFVGNLCKMTLVTFTTNTRRLPTWGAKIDADVAMYVRGLQDWMVGSLHWSFETERYFGKSGPHIRMHHMVTVLPPVTQYYARR